MPRVLPVAQVPAGNTMEFGVTASWVVGGLACVVLVPFALLAGSLPDYDVRSVSAVDESSG